MKSMKITIYTIPDCQFCKQEKDYLTSKGLPFDEKDVMANKDFLAEMLQKSQNFAGVPFTIMEEGASNVVLKGFTQSEFDDAIAKMSGSPVMGAQTDKVADIPLDLDEAPVDKMPAAQSTGIDTNMASPAPFDMPKPAMPSVDMPAVSPMSSSPAMPPAPSMGQPATPSVPQPTQPLNSFQAHDTDLDDPQEELNSLLEDLQTKVDVTPAPSQSNSVMTPTMTGNTVTPSAPAMPSTDMPAVSPMPSAPAISAAPSLGQQAPSAPQAMADLNAGQ